MFDGSEPVLRIVVPGLPRGKGRPRVAVIAGRARMFTPKQTAKEESAVRLFASQAMEGRAPMDGAIDLRVCAYLPVPASWSKRKQADALGGVMFPTGRPDADNIVKLLADGMNAIVWRDDTQIVNLSIWKRYSDTPRVVIEVRQI